jgi:hypothetical protein
MVVPKTTIFDTQVVARGFWQTFDTKISTVVFPDLDHGCPALVRGILQYRRLI